MDKEVLPLTVSTYRTSPKKLSIFARTVPTLCFYSRFFGVVLRASNRAKSGDYDGDAWAASSLEVLRLLEDIGVCLQVSGVENIQKAEGPCVIIGNHMSMMETVVLPSIIQPVKPVTFVVKESLLNYPVFKYIMRSRNPVAVSRTNPRQDLKIVMEEGEKRLQQGMSVIVFPQTTRSNTFDPEQMSSIGVKLAKKSGVAIIPLALQTDAWQNGKYFKDFGRINKERIARFAFGNPLQVTGKGTEEQQAINLFIGEKMRSWAENRE